MKHTFFLLFFAQIVSAQTVTKQYVLGADSLTYFEVVTVTQDDESAVTTKTRVGPAAALAGDQADKIEAQTRELSAQAQAARRVNARINEITAVDASIFALTAVSPLKAIQARNAALLTAQGWTIDSADGSGFVGIVFTINAQNNLRYSIAGGATRGATIYGDILTLNGFPATGINTDFFISENGQRFFALQSPGAQIKKP